MSTHKQTILKLPAHWASYLVNMDPSGLVIEEMRKCEAVLAREGLRVSDCASCDDEYFSTANDAGEPAGLVCEFFFLSRQN